MTEPSREARRAELKPCPFCGQRVALVPCRSMNTGTLYFDLIHESEDDCMWDLIPSYETEAEAIAAWNQRAIDEAGAGWVPVELWDTTQPQPWQAYCPHARGRKVFEVWWFTNGGYRDSLGVAVEPSHLCALPAPPEPKP